MYQESIDSLVESFSDDSESFTQSQILHQQSTPKGRLIVSIPEIPKDESAENILDESPSPRRGGEGNSRRGKVVNNQIQIISDVEENSNEFSQLSASNKRAIKVRKPRGGSGGAVVVNNPSREEEENTIADILQQASFQTPSKQGKEFRNREANSSPRNKRRSKPIIFDDFDQDELEPQQAQSRTQRKSKTQKQKLENNDVINDNIEKTTVQKESKQIQAHEPVPPSSSNFSTNPRSKIRPYRPSSDDFQNNDVVQTFDIMENSSPQTQSRPMSSREQQSGELSSRDPRGSARERKNSEKKKRATSSSCESDDGAISTSIDNFKNIINHKSESEADLHSIYSASNFSQSISAIKFDQSRENIIKKNKRRGNSFNGQNHKIIKQKKAWKGGILSANSSKMHEAEDILDNEIRNQQLDMNARHADYISAMNQISQMQGWNAFPYFIAQPAGNLIDPNIKVSDKDGNENLPPMPQKTINSREVQRFQPPYGYMPFTNPYQMSGFIPYPGFTINDPQLAIQNINSLNENLSIIDNTSPQTIPSKSQRKKKDRNVEEPDDRKEDQINRIGDETETNKDARKVKYNEEETEKNYKEANDNIEHLSKRKTKIRDEENELSSQLEKDLNNEKCRDEVEVPITRREIDSAGKERKEDLQQPQTSPQKERKKRSEDIKKSLSQQFQPDNEENQIDIFEVHENTSAYPAKRSSITSKDIITDTVTNNIDIPLSQTSPQTTAVSLAIPPPMIPNHTAIPSIAEHERISAIYALGILDYSDNGRLNKITQMTLRLLGGVCCVLSIVDVDKVMWASSSWSQNAGVQPQPPKDEPRYESFCSWVVQDETGRGITILDTKSDPRCTHMRAKYGLEFYAGVPLITSDKKKIGALSVRGPARTHFSVVDMNILFEMASWASGEIDTISQQKFLETKHHMLDSKLKLNNIIEDIKDSDKETGAAIIQSALELIRKSLSATFVLLLKITTEQTGYSFYSNS